MRGRVEPSRGGVELQFGDFVLDADLTDAQKAEWWYDAAEVGAVQPGKVWRPWPVLPDTLRYSGIALVYLPVDVSLMGIDPSETIAVGDGANDLSMMGEAGISVAYHAKPTVRAQAKVAINQGGLDRLLEVLR